MNFFREMLYRPKRSDKSLMARFYFADANLSSVAQELDSFDGRKDPERCSCLVNRLRSCQDKVLNICNKMLEEIDPGCASREREFRAKFPDDILTDNLPGQLWFGAECLAAGSSIMHKEEESDAMRPLAKAVTRSLEKVRTLLREQALSPQPEYTENIRENIKIFDRLFAEFEFNYVQCMVHVKSVREYELHQDLIVLFSETLQRALKNGMVTQEMIDFCEPSLMFAIPRLAIVYGLLISPDGPLNVERSSADFPELFLPFKNLLRKIRELLLTLDSAEIMVLEMLLCQHEEPANIATKLKEVERRLKTHEKSEEQAKKLQERLHSPEKNVKGCDKFVRDIVDEIVTSALERALKLTPEVEMDCTEVKVSSGSDLEMESTTDPEVKVNSRSDLEMEPTRSSSDVDVVASPAGSSTTAFSPRPRQRLKRHNAKRDSRRIPIKYQKDRRAKFKSTEDLLHRLYVCISGAADQLQSNYAGDFRSILRNVFIINLTKDEEEVEAEEEAEEEEDDDTLEGAVGGIPEDQTQNNQSNPTTPTTIPHSTTQSHETSMSSSRSLPAGFEVDLATDALTHQLSQTMQSNLFTSNDDLPSSTPSGVTRNASTRPDNDGKKYAQNLGLQLQDGEENVLPTDATQPVSPRGFFQPEPTLMDIAAGSVVNVSSVSDADLPPEQLAQDSTFIRAEDRLGHGEAPRPVRETPPRWQPDEEAQNCMGCRYHFTIWRRRHHCRNCGLVFCNRCSGNFMSLPQYGIERHVRVCNRCKVLIRYPDSPARRENEQEDLNNEDEEHPQSVTMWSRNFGMVS